MKIILQECEFSNWFSYGKDNKLNLSEYPVVQIAASNGSGKTSVPLIIQEILYNKNFKGIKKNNIPNRYIKNNDLYGKLTFIRDTTKYIIELTRKSTIKISINEGGEDISSHTSTDTYKTIEEILGIDFKTFCQLTYQSSNTSLEFLTATDTARKKFLVGLFNLDEYTKIHELFKVVHKEISTELATISGKVSTISKWIENTEKQDKSVKALLSIPALPESEVKELGLLEDKLKNIESLNSAINKNNQYKKLLDSVDKSLLVKSIDKPESDTELKSKKIVLEERLKASKAMGDKISRLGDVCPACMQAISPTVKNKMLDEERSNYSSINSELSILNETISKLAKQAEEYNKVQKAIKDFETYTNYIDTSLQEEVFDSKELSKQVQELRAKITKINSDIKKAEQENLSTKAHNSKIEVLSEQLKEYRAELDKESTNLKQISEKLNYVDILKNAFSTNGLVNYKIESLIKELEVQINNYLSELSSGRFLINFALSGEKLNVEIVDSNHTVDIESLSSGELARVNMSTLLAIRKLLSGISGAELNILFLDEIFGVLDSEGKQTLLEVLANENLNTFIVSHEFSHPLIPVLNVIKENGVSRLEWQ